jgi:uncharacterized cupin superfamily protein
MDEAFVVNLADAPVLGHSRRASRIALEPDGVDWPDTGVNVQILQPGQPNCRYHSEPVQEDFLVLHGECLLIMDGEERRLRTWDFVHCPAGTAHVFVGAGDGPSAVLMIGSRRLDEVHYLVEPLAARWDASVREPTDEPAQAYADWRVEEPRPVPNPWPLDGAQSPSSRA